MSIEKCAQRIIIPASKSKYFPGGFGLELTPPTQQNLATALEDLDAENIIAKIHAFGVLVLKNTNIFDRADPKKHPKMGAIAAVITKRTSAPQSNIWHFDSTKTPQEQLPEAGILGHLAKVNNPRKAPTLACPADLILEATHQEIEKLTKTATDAEKENLHSLQASIEDPSKPNFHRALHDRPYNQGPRLERYIQTYNFLETIAYAIATKLDDQIVHHYWSQHPNSVLFITETGSKSPQAPKKVLHARLPILPAEDSSNCDNIFGSYVYAEPIAQSS